MKLRVPTCSYISIRLCFLISSNSVCAFLFCCAPCVARATRPHRRRCRPKSVESALTEQERRPPPPPLERHRPLRSPMDPSQPPSRWWGHSSLFCSATSTSTAACWWWVVVVVVVGQQNENGDPRRHHWSVAGPSGHPWTDADRPLARGGPRRCSVGAVLPP